MPRETMFAFTLEGLESLIWANRQEYQTKVPSDIASALVVALQQLAAQAEDPRDFWSVYNPHGRFVFHIAYKEVNAIVALLQTTDTLGGFGAAVLLDAADALQAMKEQHGG